MPQIYVALDLETTGVDAEQDLVYVVQTCAGQETLTPAEFAGKYAWENDPNKVGL